MEIKDIVIIAVLAVNLVLLIVLLVKANKSGGSSELIELKNEVTRLSQLSENENRQLMDQSARQSETTVNQISQLGDSLRDNVLKTMTELGKTMSDGQSRQREDVVSTMNELGTTLGDGQNQQKEYVVRTMTELGKSLSDGQERQQNSTAARLLKLETDFNNIRRDILETLEKIRAANTESMEKLRRDNQTSLDKINDTVNEKLQKTLDDKIAKSFEAVNLRLKEVYEGLGEMKSVASGVSDLKNVLSNVKTRGIMGEIQLGAILGEILAPELYGEQVAVNPESREMVDFAVKLPGADDGEYVYLPIDSKFPGDTYSNLLSAYDLGDPNELKEKRAVLDAEIKRCAKSIHDKYINPPYTTDFAILFLPFEGLYAEVVNMGMVELLQREYRVNIAGPSTMAAMLNSLQMGFKTLAIQRKSGDIRKILEAAKKEFTSFETVLIKTRDRLRQADDELEKLVGTRTRQINRALKEIELPDGETDALDSIEE